MQSMFELQKWFKLLVIKDQNESQNPNLEEIKETATFSSQTRLGVYQFAYMRRLQDALIDDFPGVQSILGENRFDVIAEKYFKKHFSTSPTLTDAGWDFESFLRENPVSKEIPLIGDLACLEWLEIRSFNAPIESQMDSKKTEMTSDEKAAKVIFQKPQHCFLFQSEYPLDEVRKLEKILGPKRSYYLIFRDETMFSVVRRISKAEYSLLFALYDGVCLGDAILQADLTDPELVQSFFQSAPNWLI